MKTFLGIIIGIILALSVREAIAAELQRGRVIANLDSQSTFGNDVKVTKITDGSVNCYVGTSKQQSGNLALSGTMVAISCIKMK